MTDYGVVPEGFARKPLSAVLASVEARQHATISPTLDVSPESVHGQVNASIAREIAMLWEVAEDLYHSDDPDAAEDAALEMIARLTGTERSGATYSRGACTVNLDVGTVLESGVHFAAVDGNPGLRATPEEDFTAPSTGNHTVIFRAENTGPVLIGNGLLTVISTPVTGWNSVENTEDIDGGKEVDTDAELRERRAAQLTASGSATVDAIGADLLELTDGNGIELIQSVRMFNNRTSSLNADGLPPHSFQALIFDGDPPEADNDAIAQVIWDAMPAGIQSFGDTTGNAEDDNGDTQPVLFSRVTPLSVYVDYTLTTGDGYSGDAAMKEYVATQCNALFNSAGADVNFFAVADIPRQFQPGIITVDSCRIGFAAAPTGTATLAVGPRQLARFATSRVTRTP